MASAFGHDSRDTGMKLKPEDLKTIIASRTRSEAGASAPAHGLYLTEVAYPKEIFEKYGE